MTWCVVSHCFQMAYGNTLDRFREIRPLKTGKIGYTIFGPDAKKNRHVINKLGNFRELHGINSCGEIPLAPLAKRAEPLVLSKFGLR